MLHAARGAAEPDQHTRNKGSAPLGFAATGGTCDVCSCTVAISSPQALSCEVDAAVFCAARTDALQ